MKKRFCHSPSTASLLAFLVVLLAAVCPAEAQISYGPTGTKGFDFVVRPTVADGWSTLSVPGNGGTLRSEAELDAMVAATAATQINTQLVAFVWPNPTNLAMWTSSSNNLSTSPFSNACTLLMATLRNDSGGDVAVISILYEFGVSVIVPSSVPDPVPGQLVYYSLTGAAGSWTKIPELSGDLPGSKFVSLSLAGGVWSSGSNLYLLWADDDAEGRIDPAYTIDNFQVGRGVLEPPAVVVSPSPVVVQERQVARLAVEAGGSMPTYQWYRGTPENAVPISGAISPTLLVTNITRSSRYPWTTPLDEGNYFVRVSGPGGAPVDSAVASVSVVPDTTPPAIVYAVPTTVANQLGVVVSEPLDNRAKGVTNLASWEIRSLDNLSTLAITRVSYTDNGTSTNITLTLSSATPRDPNRGYRISVMAPLPDTATASNLLPASSSTLLYCFTNQVLAPTAGWRFNDADVDPVDQLPVLWSDTDYNDTGAPWVTGAGLFDAKRGGGGAAGLDCRDAGVSTLGPVGTCLRLLSPVTGTNLIAAYFRTRFSFAGNPTNAVLQLRGKFDDGAVVYLNGREIWRIGMPGGVIRHTNLASRTVNDTDAQDVFVFRAPTLLQSGENQLAFSLHQVNLTSSDLYAVLEMNELVGTPPPPVPPAITRQPESSTNVAGSAATFRVEATGTAPLTYAWYQGGVLLAGQTNALLTLNPVTPGAAGSYWVVVTNAGGGVTSVVATLTVAFPASITGQPAGRTNVAGSLARFSVTASGSPLLAYQWRRNALPLSDGPGLAGTGTPDLWVTNVSPAVVGGYDVVVANDYGSVTSRVATLVLVPFQLDYAGQDLRGLDFSGLDLAGVNFSGCNLAFALFRFASLSNATLSGANLDGADLETARLDGAVLARAVYSPATRWPTGFAHTNAGMWGPGTDLQGQNLSALNFSNLDFTRANLSACNLQVADLRGTRLVSANLAGADLRGAKLAAADLTGANLAGVNLTGAVFSVSTRWPVDFDFLAAGMLGPGVDLAGQNLAGRMLAEVDLTGASLVGANLDNADLSRAVLVNAMLTGASLRGARLVGADLTGASLDGAVLTRAVFSTATRWPAEFAYLAAGMFGPGVDYTGQDLSGLYLGDIDFTGANFTGANLGQADLRRSSLVRAVLSGADLTGASLLQAVLTGAIYDGLTRWPAGFDSVSAGMLGPGSNLGGSNLSNLNLSGLDLRGANLAGANLSNAVLRLARLVNAGLAGADLRGCDLRGADLTGANLDGAQLAGARFDLATRWPAGFAYLTAGLWGPGVDYGGLNLSRLNFAGYDFSGASFAGANLTNASFNQAILSNANFRGAALANADLRLADLRGADLRGADLRGALLTDAQLAGALYDARTAGPAGFAWASSGAILATPPVVTVAPTNVVVVAGGSVTLQAAVEGFGPFTTRWRHDGDLVADATNTTLHLMGVFPESAGAYRVEVTNPSGSSTSGVAVVSVVLPPIILTQPQDQLGRLGFSATFSVQATGTGLLAYQWQRGAIPIPGATNASLTLSNLTLGDAVNYRVVITNAFGVVTSSLAVLTLEQSTLAAGPAFSTNGLVAYYPFEGNVRDASGYDNNPRPAQHVLTTNRWGHPQGALRCSPTAPMAAIPYNPAAFDFRQRDFTISFWLMIETPGAIYSRVLNSGFAWTETSGFVLSFYSGSREFWIFSRMADGGKINGNSSHFLPSRKWVHFVMRRTGSRMDFFANGFLYGGPNFPANLLGSTNDFEIGCGTGSEVDSFRGAIDDLRIYDRALPDVEIKGLNDYESVPPDNSFLDYGILAFYSFNGNAVDTSGNDNHAFASGTTPAPNRFGQAGAAYEFNGLSSRVVANLKAQPVQDQDRSVVFWQKFNGNVFDPSPAVPMAWGSNGVNSLLGLQAGSLPKVWTAHFGSPAEDLPSAALVDNEWHQIAMVYNNGNGRGLGTLMMYVDGEQFLNAPKTLATSPGVLSLGSSIHGLSGTNHFSGLLDDVRVYNRALSSPEVKAVFAYDSVPDPGVPRGASALAQVANGSITAIALTDPGARYSNAPIVTIVGGGGSGASAVATVSNGVIVAISILNGGSGYTGIPTVTIAPPPFPSRRARATCALATNQLGGFVALSVVIDGGFGYTEPPAVRLEGGGGTGATARSVVVNGSVTDIIITAPGSGYTNAPQVVIGSPYFAPVVAVRYRMISVSLKVVLGRSYQLESSPNLETWTPAGLPFTAEQEDIIQELEVRTFGQFYRLRDLSPPPP